MQQAMQRLLAAHNQCTTRVAQTDDRMEQFRSNLRRDALDLALTVKRIEQDVQYQYQSTARLKQSLQNDVQERVKGLEEKLLFVMEHETHVNQTIDRNAHSQCASIEAIMAEQRDVRTVWTGGHEIRCRPPHLMEPVLCNFITFWSYMGDGWSGTAWDHSYIDSQ